ncbi:MAG: hypothetical protein K2M00_07590 [Muribaculaceae bacterium]|nr:hypothetical protein [Muribaculaceae bacterium]
MKKINLSALLTAMLTAVLMSACNGNGTDVVETFMAFATLENTTDKGCTFTTQEGPNTPVVTFTSPVELKNDRYPVGNRYIIGYTNESNKRFESGPITLALIMDIANGKIESATSEAIKSITADPMNPTMITRTGQWLNIEAIAPIQIAPTQFGLYVDRDTENNEIPDVYIGFVTDNTGSPYRQFYGSFSLEPLWSKESCRGIKLHIKLNGKPETIDYMKASDR